MVPHQDPLDQAVKQKNDLISDVQRLVSPEATSVEEARNAIRRALTEIGGELNMPTHGQGQPPSLSQIMNEVRDLNRRYKDLQRQDEEGRKEITSAIVCSCGCTPNPAPASWSELKTNVKHIKYKFNKLREAHQTLRKKLKSLASCDISCSDGLAREMSRGGEEMGDPTHNATRATNTDFC